MKTPARKTVTISGGTGDWQSLWPWISAYLHDKTTPRKIVEWHGWAYGRLKDGWASDAVKDHLRFAWGVHQMSHPE